MHHCYRANKGVTDRSFRPERYPFHKQTYHRLLEKCKAEVYPDATDGDGDYYIADSSGVSIYNSLVIKLDQVDGSEQEIAWSIGAYLQLSKKQYQSRTTSFVRRSGQQFLQWYICMLSNINLSQQAPEQ